MEKIRNAFKDYYKKIHFENTNDIENRVIIINKKRKKKKTKYK